ncbi:MAG: beta-glucosidase [Myxococcota bacterium]
MRTHLSLLPLWMSCTGTPSSPPVETGPELRPPDLASWCPADAQAVEARIDALLPQLTVEQKARLMAGAAILPIGGTWNATRDDDLGIPGFRMLDGPRGLSTFSNTDATAFPVGMARGATWDPLLEHDVGAAIGRELLSAGANVLLAPTINVLRHPLWGRAQETYGEDPHHIGDMAVGFVKGAQSQGIMASAKHYAVNSIEDTRFEVDVQLSETALREIYLPHFKRMVTEARVASVMTAYNSVNGAFCSENVELLDILKREWGFEGFVESDWVWGTHNTVPALEAGLDLEMPLPSIYGDDLADAVQRGEADEALLDGAMRRLLRAQFCYENPPTPTQGLLDPAHVALAREVARRSVVLLENRDAALPLDPAADLVVLGRLADVENIGDTGSSNVQTPDVVTALEGLTERFSGEITHIPHAVLTPDDELRIAKASAVVVVTGFNKDDEGEDTVSAGDRDQLGLFADQVALIEAVTALHDRVIVILEGGAAIDTQPWATGVEALMMAWYPGMEGGHALAELLAGDHNFSGRLPIVFPASLDHLPPFDNVSTAVTYEDLHGYRWLEDKGHAPQYAFGYGRAYGNVTLDDATGSVTRLLADETLTVTTTLTNTGSWDRRETVQIYAADPLRRLVAAAQIDLAAGASETLAIEVPADRLARWDDTTRRWAVASGTHTLLIGTSSLDLPHTIEVTVP